MVRLCNLDGFDKEIGRWLDMKVRIRGLMKLGIRWVSGWGFPGAD